MTENCIYVEQLKRNKTMHDTSLKNKSNIIFEIFVGWHTILFKESK